MAAKTKTEKKEKIPGGITGKGFKPGQSGNPGGRPAVVREFRERCREFMTAEGWEHLKEIARAKRHRDRYRALELIAAYAFGKPTNKIELSGPDDSPLFSLSTQQLLVMAQKILAEMQAGPAQPGEPAKAKKKAKGKKGD